MIGVVIMCLPWLVARALLCLAEPASGDPFHRRVKGPGRCTGTAPFQDSQCQFQLPRQHPTLKHESSLRAEARRRSDSEMWQNARSRRPYWLVGGLARAFGLTPRRDHGCAATAGDVLVARLRHAPQSFVLKRCGWRAKGSLRLRITRISCVAPRHRHGGARAPEGRVVAHVVWRVAFGEVHSGPRLARAPRPLLGRARPGRRVHQPGHRVRSRHRHSCIRGWPACQLVISKAACKASSSASGSARRQRTPMSLSCGPSSRRGAHFMANKDGTFAAWSPGAERWLLRALSWDLRGTSTWAGWALPYLTDFGQTHTSNRGSEDDVAHPCESLTRGRGGEASLHITSARWRPTRSAAGFAFAASVHSLQHQVLRAWAPVLFVGLCSGLRSACRPPAVAVRVTPVFAFRSVFPAARAAHCSEPQERLLFSMTANSVIFLTLHSTDVLRRVHIAIALADSLGGTPSPYSRTANMHSHSAG